MPSNSDKVPVDRVNVPLECPEELVALYKHHIVEAIVEIVAQSLLLAIVDPQVILRVKGSFLDPLGDLVEQVAEHPLIKAVELECQFPGSGGSSC